MLKIIRGLLNCLLLTLLALCLSGVMVWGNAWQTTHDTRLRREAQDYMVRFIVKSEANGELIEGTIITLNDGRSGTTDASGEWQTQLSAGDYTYSVEHKDFIPFKDGQISVVDADLKEEVALRVNPEGRHEVKFRLLEGESKAPLKDVQVTFKGLIRNTAGDGLVTFRADPGDYSLKAEAPDYEPYEATITVGNEDLLKAIVMTPDQKLTTVHYFVFDRQTTDALEGVTLTDEAGVKLGTTNFEGKISLAFPPGVHTVLFTAPGYNESKDRVDLKGAEKELPRAVPMAPMEPLKYAFHVTVRNAITKARVPQAEVTIVNPPIQMKTSNAGIASFQLPNGRYQYQVTHSQYKPSELLDITIADALQSVEVELQPYDLSTPAIHSKVSRAMIFPNPCRGMLCVKSEEGVYRYQIFTLTGVMVDDDAPRAHETRHFTFDTQGLTPGLYLLKLIYAEGEWEMLRFQVE